MIHYSFRFIRDPKSDFVPQVHRVTSLQAQSVSIADDTSSSIFTTFLFLHLPALQTTAMLDAFKVLEQKLMALKGIPLGIDKVKFDSGPINGWSAIYTIA